MMRLASRQRILATLVAFPLAAQQPARVVPLDTFFAVSAARPDPAPARWRMLLGEYGRGDTAVVTVERAGTLYALVPGARPQSVEEAVFQRDSTGRAVAVRLGGVVFTRLAIGPEASNQLRVQPLRPVAELLREARAAQPPAERGVFRRPDLVDLATLDAGVRLDIRYATTNNFLGSAFYPQARALLQRPAAEALVRAHQRLRGRGYGLLVHDGYRPWYVTKVFWDATPPERRWLVADPAQGSRHNRGCAVDLTLYHLATGAVVDMGGTYDEATERSHPHYPVATTLQAWHRELLRQAMEAEGFVRLSNEWWHFDYKEWRSYPILNVTFEE